MFDPQTAIAAWRARLTETGSFLESDLDELESHLRDEIEALEEGGLASEAAFGAAQERLGDASALAAEFARANPAVAWRARFFWTAVGCFTTIVAAPLLWLVSHAVLVLGLGLHLGRPFIQGLMWMIMLAPPLVYFAELFLWVRRHQRVPTGMFAWAAWSRVALLVGFGCLVALVGQRLDSVARLGSGEIHGVTWGIVLAAPVLSLGATYSWLRRRLPPPAPLLRARVSVGMILAISGVAVACYLSMDRVAPRAQRLLGMSVYLDAIHAWELASLIVACVMPVAIGAIMLRLRNDPPEVETG